MGVQEATQVDGGRGGDGRGEDPGCVGRVIVAVCGARHVIYVVGVNGGVANGVVVSVGVVRVW